MNKEQIKTFWKDYPNTDTPLDANNLNTLNEELLKIAEEDKYYQATATDNGDYKIDIDKTFSNGDVIKIMFPTATDNDKQARLSVDDGNTYYNVEGIKAEHIENNNLELLFKNNEWLFISDIIDSGSNANGKWTKYKDGTMICSNTKTVTTTLNSAYGAFYITPYQAGQKFPKQFTGVPDITQYVESATNVWLLSAAMTTNTTSGGTFVLGVASSASITFKLTYLATGRWK